MLNINSQKNNGGAGVYFTSDVPPVIVQIVPSLEGGGVEQGVVDINKAITGAGGTSIVVSNGGDMVRRIEQDGGLHIKLPVHSKNPITMIKNITKLKDIIKNYKVQIIHACSRAPAWSAERASKEMGVHYITSCHAAHRIGSGIKRFYNSSIARGGIVITVSHFLEEYLKNEYKVAPEKIRVIHRGISLDKYHPNSVTPDRLIKIAKDWRVPDGAEVIILPARFSRGKGHFEAIDALSQLTRRDFFCVFVGKDKKGNYRQELEEYISKKGLEGFIRIVDHCDDMPAAYMLASVVICPTTQPEGFGRIPIEAQAMGRPVIATDHGGFKESIRHGETGWLVPVGDSQTLSQTIDFAMSLDSRQRAVLATQAMSHIADNFLNEQMCAKTLGVYAEVLGISLSNNKQNNNFANLKQQTAI